MQAQPEEHGAQPVSRQDAEALHKSFADYAIPIYRFIYSQVGNKEDAEDLTSQVFLKAVRGLDLERDEGSIRRWLYQVARTTVADFWRRYLRSPEVKLPDLNEIGSVESALNPNPGSAERAGRILQELPDNYRAVLTRRFLQGQSLKETAQELGITLANVKVLQHRALQKAAEVGRRLAE